MTNLIIITIGGALGSMLRYLIHHYTHIVSQHSNFNFLAKLASFFPASFPFATFFVNVFGSLLVGFIYYLTIKNFDSFDVNLKNFLFFGVFGGFTTFSTFSLDFLRLFSAGQIHLAITYVLLSVILALLGIFFGFYLAKIIF